jgi:hypothetical protein
VVENGQVKKEWTVVYTEDNDDSTSGKELAEQGYTLPEYHFVAEYNGTESGESPVLDVRGWIEVILDKQPENNFLIVFKDGKEEYYSSKDLMFKLKNIPIGEVLIYHYE